MQPMGTEQRSFKNNFLVVWFRFFGTGSPHVVVSIDDDDNHNHNNNKTKTQNAVDALDHGIRMWLSQKRIGDVNCN